MQGRRQHDVWGVPRSQRNELRQAAKSYIYYETNNWGENVYSRGSVDGDTWTNQSEMSGKTVRGRFILKRVSDDSATFSFDMGMGSDPLANVMQGKQTRQK